MALTDKQWLEIEALYRAGVLSTREIGRQFKVSDTAVRKKAAANGWQRDLTDATRERANQQVLQTAGNADAAEAKGRRKRGSSRGRVRAKALARIDDEAIIEFGANVIARRISGHMTLTKTLRAKFDRLNKLIGDFIDPEGDTADIKATRKAEAQAVLFLAKGDTLAGHLKVLAALHDAIQRLERISLGMDGKTKVEVSGSIGATNKPKLSAADLDKMTTAELAGVYQALVGAKSTTKQ